MVVDDKKFCFGKKLLELVVACCKVVFPDKSAKHDVEIAHF